jgi:hypothetical protein
MAEPFVSQTPKGVQLRFSWLTACLAFILFFTFFNGFINAVYVEYGPSCFAEATFLGEPADLHADLVKSGLSLATEAPRDLWAWPPHYQDFYLHNPYGKITDVDSGRVTVFGVTPLTLVFLSGTLHSVMTFGPSLVVYGFYFAAWLWLAGLCWYSVVNVRQRLAVFLVLALGYPFLFLLTRANIGAFPASIALLPYVYLCCGRRHLVLAAVCFAIACNIRPNAVLLTPLFLAFGFRRALLGASIWAILLLAIGGISYFAATQLVPGYSWQVMLKALSNYQAMYVVGAGGDGGNNSLYGAIKILFRIALIQVDGGFLLGLNKVILVGCGILIFVAAYQFWRGRLSVFAFAFAVTCLYVLGSTVFSIYHLLIFYPFVLMAGGREEMKSFPPIILAFTALALIPKNYFFFFPNISCEVVLNPLILTGCVAWILFFKLPGEVPAPEEATQPSSQTGKKSRQKYRFRW